MRIQHPHEGIKCIFHCVVVDHSSFFIIGADKLGYDVLIVRIIAFINGLTGEAYRG